jgi:hypothetical protein
MKSKTKTFVFVGLSAVLLAAIIGVYMYNKPAKDISGTSPDFQLTSVDLNKEFIAQDSLSEAKYLGKILELTGVIADIQADSIHGIILTLDDPTMGVRCTLDKKLVPLTDKDKLTKGKAVKVKGLCAGFDPVFGVVLNRCSLLEP